MNLYAQAIYVARLEKGLSQKELALKAGIPQPNLSQIEKGRDFKVSTLSQIASALELPVDALLKGPDPAPINKKRLFQRDIIEKVVARVAANRRAPKEWHQAAELIAKATGKGTKRYAAKRASQISWYNFKKAFTNEEIKTILSKLEKAKQRAA